MIDPSIFETIGLQVTAWVSAKELRPAAALVQALTEWPDVYNSEPISIPVSPDAPGELPSVIVSSRDGAQRMEVARQRVNLFWIRQSDASPELSELRNAFAARIDAVFGSQHTTVGRLALVITRLGTVSMPGRRLAEQYFKPRWLDQPLNRPEAFEIHAHKRFDMIPGLDVNSWMRIRTGIIEGKEYSAIIVEQDINSLAEETGEREFDIDAIQGFLATASEHIDSVFALYFPTDGGGE